MTDYGHSHDSHHSGGEGWEGDSGGGEGCFGIAIGLWILMIIVYVIVAVVRAYPVFMSLLFTALGVFVVWKIVSRRSKK